MLNIRLRGFAKKLSASAYIFASALFLVLASAYTLQQTGIGFIAIANHWTLNWYGLN